jgi:hypothetical protein
LSTDPTKKPSPSAAALARAPIGADPPPAKTDDENAAKMMIKVKTLTGKTLELDIEPNDKVERIKERIEQVEGECRA